MSNIDASPCYYVSLPLSLLFLSVTLYRYLRALPRRRLALTMRVFPVTYRSSAILIACEFSRARSIEPG
jgi:hypothetical protein